MMMKRARLDGALPVREDASSYVLGRPSARGAGRRAGRVAPALGSPASGSPASGTRDYQRTVMPRFEGAAKQLTLMTLLLVCGRHSMIAAEPALPGCSPNMCMDVKDRYDVDLWRRKSGSIRFPIGAWSSPIGVYSTGTPAILAAYASANFSVLEISGGALGPVDPLTQVRLTTAIASTVLHPTG
jgi:hypothetical protein